MAARTVKDLAWLDVEDTEDAPSTVSDAGDNTYPKVEYNGSQGVIYRSSATNRVIIPWHRVLKIVETQVS
jgi:uncharacterized protein (UPF0248 family)